MKKKSFKKYCSLLLSLLLLLSLFTQTIYAQEASNSVQQKVISNTSAKSPNDLEASETAEKPHEKESKEDPTQQQANETIPAESEEAVKQQEQAFISPRSSMRILMQTSIDGQAELEGLKEIEVTITWLESLAIKEPVKIAVTNEAMILADDISDIEFTTNGVKKDISDLVIEEGSVKFMTGTAASRSTCTLTYKVKAPVAAGDFKISTKIAAENAPNTLANYAEKIFTVTSGLTVETTYETIFGDTPFHVFGLVNYHTAQVDPDLVISLDVYNEETGEVVYELTGADYPTDNSYDIGPLAFPDSCAEGTYIVHVTLADGWNIIGTASKQISYVKSKEFKITVWDIVRKINSENSAADLKFSREFTYDFNTPIAMIQPMVYENETVTVTISPDTGESLQKDENNNITGMMPGSNVEITYLHEIENDILKEIVSINVIKEESLKLSDEMKPFNFLWVARSEHGTVVKINTDTNEIIGEYKTAPEGQPLNPSRTTVDKDGNLWVANRNGNSVTKIGLVENGQYREGTSGTNTSTGFGDVKSWSNANGADTKGGVSTAADDCILQYVKTSSTGTRHVSVDKDNNVWVSGTGNRIFDLIDTNTGNILKSEGPVGFGGYGGLIDDKGVIWSSNPMLRWDTSTPLSGDNGVNWKGYDYTGSYGLGIDSQGNVWNSTNGGDGKIRKLSPDGTIIGTYNQGNTSAQGVVVGLNDDVWVAHSLNQRTIGHLKNDGTYVGTLTVASAGGGPTGVAVDNKGYIWATLYDGNVIKIDPNDGPVGVDGVTPVGRVIKTIPVGGQLYNYSDMTGSTLLGAPDNGTYEFVFDSQKDDVKWSKIEWRPEDLEENTVDVFVSSSTDGTTFSKPVAVNNNDTLNIPNGRHIKVKVHLHRGASGNSPVLDSIVVTGEAESAL